MVSILVEDGDYQSGKWKHALLENHVHILRSAGFKRKKKHQVNYVITIEINCRFSLNLQCNGVAIQQPAGLFSFQFIKKWIPGAKIAPTESSEDWRSYQALRFIHGFVAHPICAVVVLPLASRFHWEQRGHILKLLMWGGNHEFQNVNRPISGITVATQRSSAKHLNTLT